MFTEYSCTVEPVHNEHRRKKTMATMIKWHPKVHTCIQIHQVHNKHISGYIEQTLYTRWSLNCNIQWDLRFLYSLIWLITFLSSWTQPLLQTGYWICCYCTQIASSKSGIPMQRFLCPLPPKPITVITSTAIR